MAKKKRIPIDFQRDDREKSLRKFSKSIRFNAKEIEVIERYCKKYNIKSQAGFFRETIISNILEELDKNHPRLF